MLTEEYLRVKAGLQIISADSAHVLYDHMDNLTCFNICLQLLPCGTVKISAAPTVIGIVLNIRVASLLGIAFEVFFLIDNAVAIANLVIVTGKSLVQCRNFIGILSHSLFHAHHDALDSEYNFKDYAFSKLRERYKAWTGNSMEEKLFDSFEMRDGHGKLTNAGALLADDTPIKHSRLFCTRWNGLDKSGGMVDALDSAEYSGSLIILLNEGVGFVKRNMKTRWKKTANSRIEMPDYCERSVFEALVNALIHRDYLILGSEVHIDIYDDRLTITSPGGMADGTRIQERDISNISSTRRNPVLADIFGRLGYMERQGSGFKKITEAYRAAHNYRDELEPKFYSDASSFQVTLFNLNYGTTVNATKATIEDENVAIAPDHLAIEVAIDKLNASQATIAKAKAVFANMGVDGIFGRSDIAAITNDSVTAAGNLITKLKDADLIEPVSGFGKGKYKFVSPKA